MNSADSLDETNFHSSCFDIESLSSGPIDVLSNEPHVCITALRQTVPCYVIM